MTPIPLSELNELACKAANLHSLLPLAVYEDAIRIKKALRMKVWHVNGMVCAEYGEYNELDSPYASYCAPYTEHNNSPEDAEKFAITHTASRIAVGPTI